MAVAEVQKIKIISHKNDKKKIVDFLYDFGSFEISKWKGKSKKAKESTQPQVDERISEIEYRLSEIQFAISFLDEYKEKIKVSLSDKLAGSAITISPARVKEIVKQTDVKKVISTVQSLDEKMSKINSKIDNYKDERGLLEKWVDLDMKIEEARETRLTKAVFGTINSEQYLEFTKEINKEMAEVDIKKVSSLEQADCVLVIFSKELEKKIGKVFFKFGLEKVELPNKNLTPKEMLKEIKEDEKKLKKELRDLKKQIKKIAKDNLENFKILFDFYSWRTNKLSAEKDFSNTRDTFNITGWLVKSDLEVLKKGLAQVSKNFEILELEKEKGESQPVIIRNSSIMRPFEAVTSIYGLPKTTDVDPTPFLSVFFILFFGLCLTDAGYGLLLMTLTFLAIKVLKIPKESQRLIRLLMYGGFVTFIIGALTGGWFGIVLEDLPEGVISNFLISIRLINPIEDPITMLIISFVLGFIQIWVGIAIDMWWKIKNGKIMDGILGSGSWLYFLGVIAFWGMTAFGVLPESLSQLALYLIYSGVALLILTQGRKKKNIFIKFFAGVGSLYGLIGYVSDILSYSRLLALGLATAVIAMVINLIALLFKDLIPGVGWIVMILILIGGHIFNITINVLGAYIHSGRLQFVEFFPKFFSGGGKMFKPFKRESKYVKLKNAEQK